MSRWRFLSKFAESFPAAIVAALALLCVACGPGLLSASPSASSPSASSAGGNGYSTLSMFLISGVSPDFASGHANAPAAADALCAASLPAGIASAKAFLVDTANRLACGVNGGVGTANCGAGYVQTDWVLKAYTNYYLTNGTFVGTTNGVGIFTALSNAIAGASTALITGFSTAANWTSANANMCAQWTTTGVGSSMNLGQPNTTTPATLIYSSTTTCNNPGALTLYLLCVQQ